MSGSVVDREDAVRLKGNRERLLDALRAAPDRTLTNHQVRAIAGSRGMGRVNELIHSGYDIEVTKQRGATWLVRLRVKSTGQLPLI